jgi:hypothetical protein
LGNLAGRIAPSEGIDDEIAGPGKQLDKELRHSARKACWMDLDTQFGTRVYILRVALIIPSNNDVLRDCSTTIVLKLARNDVATWAFLRFIPSLN